MQISGFHSNALDPFCSFFQIFASFSWASSSLKVMFGQKACECHCLSSLSVYNILYFSLFFSFPCPLWRKKNFHFDFAVRYCGPPACADTVANQIHIIFLSLARSSPVVSRGITAEGEQRDSLETLEILSTLYDLWSIQGENSSVGLCAGASFPVAAITSIAVSPFYFSSTFWWFWN